MGGPLEYTGTPMDGGDQGYILPDILLRWTKAVTSTDIGTYAVFGPGSTSPLAAVRGASNP
jgi:hypothetical protein